MKAEDVYKLSPDSVTEEMIELARSALPDEYKENIDLVLENAEGYLEVAQRYYRLGAFNMEHKDAATCMAEDQGGWPACSHPAEYFVKAEHADGRRIVYCSEHQDSRFFSPEHLAPIYENPSGRTGE